MLKLINTLDKGMIIYLLQEGRGIGLINKINAYSLQDKYNFDTFYANSELNLDIRPREYLINAVENRKKIPPITKEKKKKAKVKKLEQKSVVKKDTNVTFGGPRENAERVAALSFLASCMVLYLE